MPGPLGGHGKWPSADQGTIMSYMKARLRTIPSLGSLLWAPLLALVLLGCDPGQRRLWLNSPVDGVLTIEDREPPPF